MKRLLLFTFSMSIAVTCLQISSRADAHHHRRGQSSGCCQGSYGYQGGMAYGGRYGYSSGASGCYTATYVVQPVYVQSYSMPSSIRMMNSGCGCEGSVSYSDGMGHEAIRNSSIAHPNSNGAPGTSTGNAQGTPVYTNDGVWPIDAGQSAGSQPSASVPPSPNLNSASVNSPNGSVPTNTPVVRTNALRESAGRPSVPQTKAPFPTPDILK